MIKPAIIQSGIFEGHQGSIYALEKINEHSFVSGGSDEKLVQWDIDNPSQGILLSRVTDGIFSIAHLKNENKLIVGSGSGGVHILDLSKKTNHTFVKPHTSFVFAFLVNEESGMLYSVAADGCIAMIRLDDYSIIVQNRIVSNKLRDICLLPIKKSLLLAATDGKIYVLDAENLQIQDQIQAHQEGFSVYSIQLSPDNKCIISSGRDAHINVMSADDYKQMLSIPAHNYAIYKLSYNPSGSILASASRDKHVKLWDAQSLSPIARLDHASYQGHINSVNDLCWLNDNTLISAGDDRSIKQWTIQL